MHWRQSNSFVKYLLGPPKMATSADDDDVFEYLPTLSAVVRPNLYVARTRLIEETTRQRYTFWGLYSHRDINRGEFIGMYNGVWIHSSQSFEFGNRYAIELSQGMSVAPPGQQPDPQHFPIAMANEPRPGTRANAFLHEWTFDRADVADIPDNIHESIFFGVGLVACDDIPANTEIRWHYGMHYQPFRDYNVGEHCRVTGVATPNPVHTLRHPLPYDAVCPFVDTPSNSEDDSDPDYGRTRTFYTRQSTRALVQNLLRYAEP